MVFCGITRVLLTLFSSSLCCPFVDGLSQPPHFFLDLTKPPDTRWSGALDEVLDAHPFEYSFEVAFREHNESLFNHLSEDQFAALGQALDDHFPVNAAEIRSLSADFISRGHYVSYEYLAAWVYYHELAHTQLASNITDRRNNERSCTGLVVEDAKSGAIIHGANMDQTPEAVRNLTLQVTFTNGSVDEVIADSVDWYWFTTGTSRMVRTRVASVQENWRTLSVQDVDSTLSAIATGAVPQILVFRSILVDGWGLHRDSGPSFADVVNACRRTPLAAPFYVIAAGVARGEGVTMARNATGVDSELWLGQNASHPWYIAQTNYDICKINHSTLGTARTCEPLGDNPLDPRRFALEQILAGVHPETAVTQLGVFSAISTYPVHNPHTAYTAIMSAATGVLTPFVRTAMCPEHPSLSVFDSRFCTTTE
eukprot:m.650402 g.650402  ORF g.650402 m.650402 type:complete len:425 (+) comp22671_c0_seq7:193-1467(+)